MRRSASLVLLAVLLAALVTSPSAGAYPAPGSEWTWPLDPRPAVLHGFDPPDHPYGPGHRGVDLAGAAGQLALAVAAGEVSFAGSVAGRQIVVVDHGRLRTTYLPVLPVVRAGDRVAAGQPLGSLVAIGSHCLPVTCLHFGVRDGEVYLDPLDFLTSGPIRLLPLAGWPTPIMGLLWA